MGNKFCKKRVDSDGTSGSKTPKTFQKIITKLNLKPKWKSDSNLDDKQINSPPISTIQVDTKAKPLSRSTDWIDCSLEAAPTDDVNSTNNQTKKSIFNDDTTPTPPPRQCKLVRKSLLNTMKDAFKTSTPNHHNNNDEEIEEQIMVKKTINYNCPCGGEHSRAQHDKQTKIEKTHYERTPTNNQNRRSKSILVTSSNNSLPNYNELRLSLPIRPLDEDDAHNSALSLPDENGSKKQHRRSITNDIDAYLTRAKSIGSLIPSVLQRLSTNKAPLAEIESDDSLNSINSMEDNWAGLTMIEHYEPRESSLPRPSRRTDAEMLADLEGMIVDDVDGDDDMESPPKPPARKTETMLKKMHKDVKSSNCTPPSTPEDYNNQGFVDSREKSFDNCNQNDHSPLMKILRKYSSTESDTNKNMMRGNLSPVHTYVGGQIDAQSQGQGKQKINEFLAAERANEELYKERERIAA